MLLIVVLLQNPPVASPYVQQWIGNKNAVWHQIVKGKKGLEHTGCG